ncbi:MAG: GAF domain-containing protein, partial [Candidatus Rokuibacteriota bacterium]
RARFLAEASRLLAASLDYASVLAAVARLAVPDLADGCIVDLLDREGRLRRETVATRDPAKEALARELMRSYPPDPEGQHPLMAVVRSGQPIVLPEVPDTLLEAVAKDPEHLRLARELNIRSALIVPLKARGKVLGALSMVSTHEKRRYGDEDLWLAEDLAQRAAVAIDNAALYEQAERRRREAETLAELARTVNASGDIDTLLQRVVDGARDVSGADLAAILLVDPASGVAVPRYRAGGMRSGRYDALRIAPGLGAGGQVLLTGRPFRTANYLEDPRIGAEYRWLAEEQGIVSLLVVPIRIEDRIAGLLYADNRRGVAFTEADEGILLRLADHAGVALHKVQALEAERTARAQAEEAAARIARLQIVTDVALAHLALDDLLRELLARIRDVLAADTAAVFLVDAERTTLVLHASAGLEAGVPHAPIPFGTGFAGRVAADGTPIVVGDLRETEAVSPVLRDIGVRSVLAVPLLVEGRVIGVVRVGTVQLRGFTPEDARLLQLVGDRAALAIEQSRLYESERAARAAAEAANRTKDEFLATLSHELRTPLNAILGWSRLLRVGGMDEARRRHAVEVIERNAEAQTQLISDLLDVSAIITGRLQLALEAVDLPLLVTAAIDAVRPAADGKGVRIEARIGDVPPGLTGDATRLRQVVWNVLSNAVKFTPRGGWIAVAVEASASRVEIRVSDSGIGIRADAVGHIFERFRQADSSLTRSYGGLGLGLAIVRHLVALHGGTVSVASGGEGHGATFVVRLPLPPWAGAGTRERGVSPAATTPIPSLDGVRVLVVDDDADNRFLLASILEDSGACVRAVASARAALGELGPFRPDVMVSDIAMPEQDGYDLIRAVRARGAGAVPAIAVTAYARAEDRDRALAAG